MIIDTDTHFLPRDSYDYIDGPLAALAPTFEYNGKGLCIGVKFPGAPPQVANTTPNPPPGTGCNYGGMCDMEERLEDYRKMGIERQVLLPQMSAMMFHYLIDPELAAVMAHSYNMAMVKLLKKYPNELVGAGLVALQDVPSAIQEVEWLKANGMNSVVIDKVFPVKSHPYSDPFGSHPELDPFYKRVEELGVVLLMHTIGAHGHRMNNMMTFQRDGLEFFAPIEGHISLVSMVTSGVFDRFPNLKVVFTESGTAFIKPMLERLDESFDKPLIDWDAEDAATRKFMSVSTGRPIVKSLVPMDQYLPKNLKPASHYFRNNIWFTIETEEEQLPDAIQHIGARQFLFATDYPHDDAGGRMKKRDVELLATNKRISEEDKEKIRVTNAKELFGI
jgi:predicted TIM-barrel fold metal-dependent hydrolase